MLIYLVFIFSTLMSLYAEITKQKRWVYINIVVLSCLVGFRSLSVGDDTASYYGIFKALQSEDLSSNVEKGFLYISYVLLKIFGSVTPVFLVYALITNFCIIYRLWTLKEKAPFSIMNLVYLIFFFAEGCNIMRQYLALSILFLATMLLRKKRFLTYSLIVLFCFFIHKTAVVAFLVLIIYVIFTDTLSKQEKTNLYLLGLAVSPLLVVIGLKVFSNYSGYLTASNNSFGFMSLGKLGIFAISAYYFSKVVFTRDKHHQFRDRLYGYSGQASSYLVENSMDNRVILFCYLAGILFSFLGYYKTTLLRVGLNLMFFEMIFIPMVCFKNKKTSRFMVSHLITAVYLALIIFVCVTNALDGWSGLGNYTWDFVR